MWAIAGARDSQNTGNRLSQMRLAQVCTLHIAHSNNPDHDKLRELFLFSAGYFSSPLSDKSCSVLHQNHRHAEEFSLGNVKLSVSQATVSTFPSFPSSLLSCRCSTSFNPNSGQSSTLIICCRSRGVVHLPERFRRVIK
jgi:hypothetical protein